MGAESTLAADQVKGKAPAKKNEAVTASHMPKDSAKAKSLKDHKKSQPQEDSVRVQERGQPSTDKAKAQGKSSKTEKQ